MNNKIKNTIKDNLNAIIYAGAYLLVMSAGAKIARYLLIQSDGTFLGIDLQNTINASLLMTILASFFIAFPFIMFAMIQQNKNQDIIKPLPFDSALTTMGLGITVYLFILNIRVIFTNYETSNFLDSFGIASTSTSILLLLLFIAMSVVIPITEEIVFRAGIQKTLSKQNETYALIMQAVLFGVAQLNITQGILSFMLGLVVGYIYKQNNYNLAPAIALHICFNSMAFIVYALDSDGIMWILLSILMLTSCYCIRQDKQFLRL